MTQAGLANHQGPCSFHQWGKLQTVLLPDYQIKIFSKERFKDLIFRGSMVNHFNHFKAKVSKERKKKEEVFKLLKCKQ
uniref:Uncharacterized protein n=1 Tax=Romanomermis culicivorax TaxID=13658 RepID=A0A915KFT0_ROMCU